MYWVRFNRVWNAVVKGFEEFFTLLVDFLKTNGIHQILNEVFEEIKFKIT